MIRFPRPLLFLLGLWLTWPVWSAEEIRRFHSDIQVEMDGSMLVEEQIQVRAEGNQIKRGIFRDFPTDYRDKLGHHYRVGFDLLDVQRDGQSEPFHLETLSNGVRIYIGDKDVHLKPGSYSYGLRYRTDRQLGFFPDHDELYWNLTGNGWTFPIVQATARIRLPSQIPTEALRLEAYTGPVGAKGQDYSAKVEADGSLFFATTRSLGVTEGLTLAIAWPKGYMKEPGRGQKIGYFLADNRDALAGLIGITLVLGFYLWSWWRVGRDPQPGAIFPRYQPPEGQSPAALRFVERMGYDDKTFAATLVNLAVKRSVRIEEPEPGAFRLQRLNHPSLLPPSEQSLFATLFGGGRNNLELSQGHQAILKQAIKAHETSLRRGYEKTYFRTNSLYLLPGILLSVLILGWILWLIPGAEPRTLGAFLTLWLSGWGLGVFVLTKMMFRAWRQTHGWKGWLKALGATLIALPFIGGAVFGLFILVTQVSPALGLSAALLIALNILFYQWLKAPTLAGRRLLDEVAGFRLYLAVAEQDELQARHPANITREEFERYLPYALALDVEQQWAERFAATLAQAGQEPQDYRPDWYSGRNWSSSRIGGFTSALGAGMTSAIAAASTPPGSSSGSGGGGSSGGGGGGGGGGGW